MVGINSRLDALQAAILGVKLKHLDVWSTARQEKAAVYNRLFAEAGLVSEAPSCWEQTCGGDCAWHGKGVVLPAETVATNGGAHIYHQYTIRVKNRDTLAQGLSDAGIGNSVYYPLCLHQQKCFSNLGYAEVEELCPHAVCAANQALSIPIYPELSEADQRRVVETIASLLAESLPNKSRVYTFSATSRMSSTIRLAIMMLDICLNSSRSLMTLER